MFGLGPPELIIILIILLIFLGPKRIPEAGKAIGQGLKEFRSAAKELTENHDSDLENDEKQE